MLFIIGRALLLIGLHLAHHTQEVASPQLLHLLTTKPFGTEATGEIDHFRSIGTTNDTTIAIKVGTYTYVVDTSHIDHIHDMAHGIINSGATLLAQETIVEAHLSHTTRGSKGTQLIVGEVAGMVTQGASRRVTAHDGGATGLNSLIEGALSSMREVDHHAYTIHLADSLTTPSTQTAMLSIATCRVA